MTTKHAIKTVLVVAALFTVCPPQVLYGQYPPPPGNPLPVHHGLPAPDMTAATPPVR